MGNGCPCRPGDISRVRPNKAHVCEVRNPQALAKEERDEEHWKPTLPTGNIHPEIKLAPFMPMEQAGANQENKCGGNHDPSPPNGHTAPRRARQSENPAGDVRGAPISVCIGGMSDPPTTHSPVKTHRRRYPGNQTGPAHHRHRRNLTSTPQIPPDKPPGFPPRPPGSVWCAMTPSLPADEGCRGAPMNPPPFSRLNPRRQFHRTAQVIHHLVHRHGRPRILPPFSKIVPCLQRNHPHGFEKRSRLVKIQHVSRFQLESLTNLHGYRNLTFGCKSCLHCFNVMHESKEFKS
jgi:hypothetical protein